MSKCLGSRAFEFGRDHALKFQTTKPYCFRVIELCEAQPPAQPSKVEPEEAAAAEAAVSQRPHNLRPPFQSSK